MAQWFDDDAKSGSNSSTLHSTWTLDKDLSKDSWSIKPEAAMKAWKDEPNKVMIVCRFEAMKQANDVSHDIGNDCIQFIQESINLTMLDWFGGPSFQDYKLKKSAIWRISISKYAILIDKNDSNEFNSMFWQKLKSYLKRSYVYNCTVCLCHIFLMVVVG